MSLVGADELSACPNLVDVLHASVAEYLNDD